MAKRILIIVRRSNGDVLLAAPLLARLAAHYPQAHLDLLVNDDTAAIAKALQPVHQIHVYRNGWRKLGFWPRLRAVLGLWRKLWRQYDIAISLTTTDSSTLLARIAAPCAISAVDAQTHKSWWKKRLLTGHYQLDPQQHIILNNMQGLHTLGIPLQTPQLRSHYSEQAKQQVAQRLHTLGIEQFIIFHPAARFAFKTYPKALRHELLTQLSGLGIAIVVTGGNSAWDLQIKAELLQLPHVHDFIAELNLDEYIALSDRALAYVGGDTLNMHLAAAQDKRIFAIFGPTLLNVWSPWSNALGHGTSHSQALQHYGNVTVFQADMPCVPCGKAGCLHDHGKSDCLLRIDPRMIYAEVKHWLETVQKG